MDSSSSKNIFIIPARSGSKGIKNKNIKLLNGVEMFAWSIIHAKYLSSKNDLIIVSSDSEKYLKIAEKWGAVPYKRPKSLSGDKVFTEPVMEDVLKNFDTKLNDKCFTSAYKPFESKSTLNQVKNFNKWKQIFTHCKRGLSV